MNIIGGGVKWHRQGDFSWVGNVSFLKGGSEYMDICCVIFFIPFEFLNGNIVLLKIKYMWVYPGRPKDRYTVESVKGITTDYMGTQTHWQTSIQMDSVYLLLGHPVHVSAWLYQLVCAVHYPPVIAFTP